MKKKTNKKRSEPKKNKKIPQSQTRSNGILVILSNWGSAIPIALGGYLISVSQEFLLQSIVLIFFGILWAAVSIWLTLIKNRSTANLTFSVIVVCGLIFCILVFNSRNEDALNPHLKLVLKASPGWPNLNLQLTNKILFSKAGDEIKLPEMSAIVAIPRLQNQTNLMLNFGLVLDSKYPTDFGQVLITVPKEVDLIQSVGWSPSLDCAGGDGAKCVETRFDAQKLLQNDGILIPPLIIRRPNVEERIKVPIHFRIRARGMPTIFCAFHIGLVTMDKQYKPHFVISPPSGPDGRSIDVFSPMVNKEETNAAPN